MTTEEKLQLFLDLQSHGRTPAEIAIELDMTEKGLRNLLRRKNYTCINGIYVFKDNADIEVDTPVKTKVVQSSKPIVKHTKKDNIEKDIELIKEMLAEIKEVAFSKNNQSEYTTNKATPILGSEIKINPLEHTSIRVDHVILRDFNDFCLKYHYLNKSYLISLALKEFIDNHY